MAYNLRNNISKFDPEQKNSLTQISRKYSDHDENHKGMKICCVLETILVYTLAFLICVIFWVQVFKIIGRAY